MALVLGAVYKLTVYIDAKASNGHHFARAVWHSAEAIVAVEFAHPPP